MNYGPTTRKSRLHPVGPAQPAVAKRTFVLSDVHGHPELIENALAHGGFRTGMDELIFAGDFVDRGPDAEGCLRLLERYATRVLVGNHELAVLLGFPLFEQTPESRRLRQTLLDRVLSEDPDAWRAVTVAEGIVVSHAGISSAYRDLWRGVGYDPERLACRLNELFLQAVRRELETGHWDDDGILGDQGPLWFRPYEYNSLQPLEGLRQVVGHTPPIEALEDQGFSMVDPCAHWGTKNPGLYRYALMQDGRSRIESGTLHAVEDQSGGDHLGLDLGASVSLTYNASAASS